MPKKQVPITSEVLAWAISDSGLSIDLLASRIDVDVVEVKDWLQGASRPGVGELDRLAKALDRTPSFFLRPRPPESSASSVSLRTPYSDRRGRQPSPEERAHIRRALRRQKIGRWASTTNEDFQPPKIPLLSTSAEDTADTARSWLRWSLTDQTAAASKTAVTRELRTRLESNNILVLQLSMGEDSCRGFSVYDDRVPLIVYNSAGQVAAARTFTLLHELAHLIHREDAVCDGSDSAHERWCDTFATAFLMPRSRFIEEAVQRLKKDYVLPTDVQSVRRLSDYFKVSYQSAALRLWEVGLAPYALFEHIRDGRIEDGPGFARGGAETPAVRLREYGTGYARLILDAYDAASLTETDVRKYLEVNGAQLAALQALVSGAR